LGRDGTSLEKKKTTELLGGFFLAPLSNQRYNQVTMILIVYGDDAFRSQEKVMQLKSAFQQKHDPTGMNLSHFVMGEKNVSSGDVVQAMTTLPFLSKHRMIIVRDLVDSVKKDDLALWDTAFARVPESTIVLLWESKSVDAVEKKLLFKSLKTRSDIKLYPLPVLVGSLLTQWIKDRCTSLGGKIEAQALRALIERIGSDLWQMHHEIEKLVAFSKGKTITESDVQNLVQANFEGKIFDLVDALSKKETQRALRLLEEERGAGSDDYYLMSMFSRQIRLLLGARAVLDEFPRADKSMIAKELDVHPFVASKLVAQAKNFSLSQLLDAHDQLYAFDRDMKRGGIQADLAVDLIATQLLSS